jgi:Tol biopolymer transport system component
LLSPLHCSSTQRRRLLLSERSTLPTGGTTEIVLIAGSGGAATPLALGGNDRMPAWSPDGRLIAFARFPAGGGNPQLYTVHPDGTDIRLRTTDYTWNGGAHPAWIRGR